MWNCSYYQISFQPCAWHCDIVQFLWLVFSIPLRADGGGCDYLQFHTTLYSSIRTFIDRCMIVTTKLKLLLKYVIAAYKYNTQLLCLLWLNAAMYFTTVQGQYANILVKPDDDYENLKKTDSSPRYVNTPIA